jgi:hypothetical protein
MKILIISAETWRDAANGGNVLSNLFQGMEAEFAQIYCNPGSPHNGICKRYFQLTDSMIINNLLKRKKIGLKITYPDYPNQSVSENGVVQENTRFYHFFRRYRWELFTMIREALWKFANWKTQELNDFIKGFEPDVIFAPCYASHYMLRLTRHVSSLTGKKVISYISDDNYSLKQWRFSPLYWINRLILRQNIKKTFPHYALLYTMTQDQKDELEKEFHIPIKILCKGGRFEAYNDKPINTPIKMIYAGGTYCGRWKTLAAIGKILKEINREVVKITLDIYTQTDCTPRQRKALNDKRNLFLHQPVNQDELTRIYRTSDIALHVESFEKKYKFMTRLSFSTKIIDCLASSCAVMAITWKHHAGLKYLAVEDAAICVSDLSRLKEAIATIVECPALIQEYRKKAFSCGTRNHRIEAVQAGLYDDFQRISQMDYPKFQKFDETLSRHDCSSIH